MVIEKLYVKKSVGTLNDIGSAVARYLKAGDTVLLRYHNKDEREIALRFHRRLKERLFKDMEDVDYPETGYVRYHNKGVEVFDSEPTGHARKLIKLEYDPFMLKQFGKAFRSMFDVFIGDPLDNYSKREKW